MSRLLGRGIMRYFKKHSYRGVPFYNTTMWYVKHFFQKMEKNFEKLPYFN